MNMELQQSEFELIRSRIHDYCGINLHDGKQALVRARVMKRIRILGLRGFSHYLDFLEADRNGKEFLSLVDVLTTNKTSFFRESQHFDFLRGEVIPQIKGRSVKWWSAGCSTGQEPVSCAITLLEQKIPKDNVKILGTDLSREVISIAKHAVYQEKKLAGISKALTEKYFNKVEENRFAVNEGVREMITYGRLNLQKHWPLSGPFHVIMCRNVMIYFNRETQQQLVSRFQKILEPGGYLILGHSESVAGANNGFQNICPAVYRKI